MSTNENSVKTLRSIHRNHASHWVGNGFPVRTLFAYPNLGSELSPFLMLDYAGPREFPPTGQRLGVGEHPHRGFETVTIVYQGEVEHRDSGGGGGHIGPGEVQWMTAASGVVHEEFHGREFARRGGILEMVQLWVNLPAKDKMSVPRYQAITHAEIPEASLAEGGGRVRVIAGEFLGVKGPARTFTPMHVWDLRLAAGHGSDLALPEGHTTLLVLLEGALRVNGSESMQGVEVGIFDRAGTGIHLEGMEDAKALLLCGEPIDEPIVGQGPFVMNTPQEIRRAMEDYAGGKMGHLS